jgi:hypothetical protein
MHEILQEQTFMKLKMSEVKHPYFLMHSCSIHHEIRVGMRALVVVKQLCLPESGHDPSHDALTLQRGYKVVAACLASNPSHLAWANVYRHC